MCALIKQNFAVQTFGETSGNQAEGYTFPKGTNWWTTNLAIESAIEKLPLFNLNTSFDLIVHQHHIQPPGQKRAVMRGGGIKELVNLPIRQESFIQEGFFSHAPLSHNHATTCYFMLPYDTTYTTEKACRELRRTDFYMTGLITPLYETILFFPSTAGLKKKQEEVWLKCFTFMEMQTYQGKVKAFFKCGKWISLEKKLSKEEGIKENEKS